MGYALTRCFDGVEEVPLAVPVPDELPGVVAELDRQALAVQELDGVPDTEK